MAEKIARRGVVVYIDGSEVKNSVAGISNEMRKLQREQKKMTIGADDYVAHGKKIGQLKALQKEHIEYQRKIAAQYDKSGNSAKGFFSKITGGFGKLAGGLAIGAAVLQGIRSWINEMLRFSTAVSELSAITGAQGADLDFLKNKAKALGAQYGMTATEIVEAMKLVGSAKPELLENAAALSDMTESVIVLSKASGMQLSDTTQNLATIMNQFGLSASEANRVINTLAAGSKYGSVEVDYLGDAIGKVGAVAASAGIDLETTVAVMELFGEKGIKAEIAGTGFKSLLVELQKDTRNYTNGVFDLNKAIDNNQKIAGDNIKLTEKFGKEYFNLAQILFQNKERFIQLNEQVTGTSTAFEQYAVATDNLRGDMDKLSASWTSFMLALEDGQGPIANTFRTLIKWAKDSVDLLAQLSKSDKQVENESLQKNIQRNIDYLKNNFSKNPINDVNKVIIKEKERVAEAMKKITEIEERIAKGDKSNLLQKQLKNQKMIVNGTNAYINALGGLRAELSKPITNADKVDDKDGELSDKEKKERLAAKEKALRDKESLKSENRRIAKELADAAISDLEETLQFAEYVQREQLAGHKQTLEEEHALKLKSLETERQLELDKAELSATSAEDAEKAKKLIRQKYQALTAEENAAFAEKQADIDKKSQEKYLSDKLAVAAQDSEEAFELEKQMREMQMAEELALVEKGSQEEKAIRDKYRKMEEDAEAALLNKKNEMLFEYANKGLSIANNLNSFLTELDNAELANFEKNNKNKANFEEEYAKKKAKMEYDAAVRAKAIAAMATIVSTSQAVMAAMAAANPLPGGNIPFAIAAGVEGALQLATILAAPLPQLWTGGFTGSGGKYEPKGVVHGNEFVANSDALNNPNLLPMFHAIDTAQRMGTVGSMKPTDLRRALREESAESNNAVRRTSDGGSIKLEKSIDRLNRLLDDGIEARSVVSGRHGSYEQTELYRKMIKNAKR